MKRALISVHDKAGVAELGRGLVALGAEILSTGGTASHLREAGVPVREIVELTGTPEMLDGRVKTLHPRIYAGILARRDRREHLAQLEAHGIEPIDLVVVTLYPFEQAVARRGVSVGEAVEQIDIGGPAMIRAAAKNWESVAVLTDPAQYGPALEELRRQGSLSKETRYRLALEGFRRTARYDAAIAAWFSDPAAVPRPAVAPAETVFSPVLKLEVEKLRPLRYGENPHQSAAFYRFLDAPPFGLAALRQLHGPELSYNNLLDISAALALLMEFDPPAAVVVKHNNPCGVGLGESADDALRKAKASDPVSIFGGIVGVNRPVEPGVVKELAGIFIEVLLAPAYLPEALEELKRTKQKCRVLELPCDRSSRPKGLAEYRSVLGGLLAQEADLVDLDEGAVKVVSRRPPTAEEWAGLRFAWKVVKHVKSNAIVLATRDQVIGVGAGQMSRVDAAKFAVLRAKELGLGTAGTVCASDAFFPFADGLEVVAGAGATAVIQPGGSVRDPEVVSCADDHGMAMVFTGIRHFRH